MKQEPFAKFYRKSISDRIETLQRQQIIDGTDSDRLRKGGSLLRAAQADRMIENVIGVFGMPMGLGVNFSINGKDYVVPMVVEEPSIVAAVSSAAKLVGAAGGFRTESDEPILIGQIVLEQMPDAAAARKAVLEHKGEIRSLANSLHPRLVARGGGVRDVEVFLRPLPGDGSDHLVVHLLVDTRDAMGANLVNSMCEGVAALIETITGGRTLLRILSNLSDRSVVRAQASIPAEALGKSGLSGEAVRDRIVSAGRFAEIDIHRATTHNKGIMNGIDAVAIATGNDWRAIEAAAHAYAAKNGAYGALTHWDRDAAGNLVGTIALPLNVGIVGGSLQSNPAVQLALRMLDLESARELAEVMAAVGLAQNLAALRALVSEGIQKGHMTLHARSVAHAAGAPPEAADEVVERLVASGDIKIWKARQILAELENEDRSGATPAVKPLRPKPAQAAASAAGKVVLLGEHAVVYGSRAIAAPLPLAVDARVTSGDTGVHLAVPRWGIDTAWKPNRSHRLSIQKAVETILIRLGITRPAIRIELFPRVPRAMGLGSSAAAAVALIRALSDYYDLSLTRSEVNRIAYESETIIHGRSSGMDNTVACYEQPLLYRTGTPAEFKPLEIAAPIPLVVGVSGVESLTAAMVAKVRQAWRNDRRRYEGIFNRIDQRVGEALTAIRQSDFTRLGRLMDENHALLSQLGVSSPGLDEMVRTARESGAVGAKLTGGGGGGAIVALCPENAAAVAAALEAGGWKALSVHIGTDNQTAAPDPLSIPQHGREERLIVVDENDAVTGSCTREACHAGDGILHRAFSIFIFDARGRLLIQRRSAEKPLWPLYWSNSCCSHPRSGESTSEAARRRLSEELGISAPLQYAYKFSYQARYGQVGSENELCWVFVGQTDQPVHANPREIDQWRYVDPKALDAEMAQHPERFTPWFKMEWERLRNHPLVTGYRKNGAPVQ
jgi:hydroxymethylglutaryl-CoA reductase